MSECAHHNVMHTVQYVNNIFTEYPGNNQLHKIIFYNSIIVNTACFYYLEAVIIAILPLCFVIIWSRDVSDDTLVELSYIYAVNAYHSLSL
jgi:hypothetical protein